MMDVLISYAAADVDVAESLAEALRALGLRAARLHEPGTHPADTSQMLAQARLVVVLWSKASVQTAFVADEAREALGRHVLVPVRLDDSMPPMGFATLHTLNLLDWDGDPAAGACRELLAQIRQRLANEEDGAPRATQQPTAPMPRESDPPSRGAAAPEDPPLTYAPGPHHTPGSSSGGSGSVGAALGASLRGTLAALGSALGGWLGRRSAAPPDAAQTRPFPGRDGPDRQPARAPPAPAREDRPLSGKPAGWAHAKPPERPRDDAPPREDDDAEDRDDDRPAATGIPLDASPSPVWFGAAAPRRATPGDVFIARLATYTDATRDSAARQLVDSGEPGDRVLSDLAPDGDAHWAIGAPVVVRLAGRHITVDPPEQRFAWNGRQHLALFSVSVAPDAPAGPLALSFVVLLAGVPMASVPMTVAISRTPVAGGVTPGGPPGASPLMAPPGAVPGPAPAAETHLQRPAPRSLFASYASRDAVEVSARLSTLLRFAPGLDIFQDCLDLTPNEDFKPQLANEILHRDSFVLFWSRRAAISPWVRWEYITARDALGLEAILPMPLEDPALAPPPPELADRHWRDRFMVAGYALKQIGQELAAAAPPDATPSSSSTPAPRA